MSPEKKKIILIASGGTQEYIDQVRFLTNVSTGKLGARLAEVAVKNGYKVLFVGTKGSKEPFENWKGPEFFYRNLCGPGKPVTIYKATSVKSSIRKIKYLCQKYNPDAVVMAMAGSDWGFKKTADKLSSDSREDFLKYLEENLVRNPKIIEYIKKWAPKTFLVGFKFMVNYGHDNLIKLARKKAKLWDAGLVIANDKAEMQKNKAHIAHLVVPKRKVKTVIGKEKISNAIIEAIEKNT